MKEHRYILGTLDSTGGLVALERNDLQRHLYAIGKTGTGKTTFLSNLILSDLENGRGFVLIDPHGDLAQFVADSVPKNRINDTIYFDPLDTHVIGFNPLVNVPPLHRGTVAARIVATFKHIWGESWGPRLEYILTNAIRLLLERRGTTLTDLPRLLIDAGYRNKLLAHCADPYISAFWKGEFAGYSERLRAEALAPIQNKVGQFANNPILRAIIGQPSTIDIASIMNSGKVLVCNLSKRMGEEPSHLLGALLVTACAQAAEQRADMMEQDRRAFTLYVDEFQNFATTSFATILSEARKWNLSLVLASQFLDQVPELLRSAVIGNVGTLTVFRVGSLDAPLLSAELGIPNRTQITTTPNFKAWIKVMHGDQPSEAMLMSVARPAPSATKSMKSVRQFTRDRHARPRPS